MRIMQVSDSDEQSKTLSHEVNLIYECFNPTNIIQMRDYFQHVVRKSLLS